MLKCVLACGGRHHRPGAGVIISLSEGIEYHATIHRYMHCAKEKVTPPKNLKGVIV